MSIKVDIQAIIELSQKLLHIERRIYRRHDLKIWYSLWFDMVGALYSLWQAFLLWSLENDKRNHDEMIADAKEILEAIANNHKIEAINHDAWFIGYYLNNSDFRIALSFHCLLKSCYPCNRKHREDKIYVGKLANNIVNSKKCECDKRPINLPHSYKQALKDFYKYEDERKRGKYRAPKNVWEQLVTVHFRVNALKHTLNPRVDAMRLKKRMDEAFKCLEAIYDLFNAIAETRGALRP